MLLVLGTPTSLTLTNATGLPISTGVSGLGTGVGTLLGGNATGSGAPVGGTSPTISGATLTNTTTVSAVNGATDVQSGTTYTLVASDCGKTAIFTSSSAVTVTIPASIVPASGTSCIITVIQAGSAKVSVNGSAVTPATLVSANSYTGTSGTAGSIITLTLTTVSATTTAYLGGNGS